MLKVPALFFLTLGVTFPSLYVFNALVGSRLLMTSALRLLLAALAVTVTVLASIGPIVAFFSVSTTSYPFILLLNVVVFAVAGLLGMSFLLQTLHRLSLTVPEPPPAFQPEPVGEEKRARPGVRADRRAGADRRTDVERARQDGLPVLDRAVRPGGRADGLGFEAVRREPFDPVHLVPAARGERLPGHPHGALEPVLMSPLAARNVLREADDVLRGRPSARAWWLLVVCGLAYGAVMGSFGGRPLQAVFSAMKVPLLLLATVGLSLPSFFIVNTLLGLRDDFARALRAVVASQAGLTVILVALAPLTAFWYASTTDYHAAILFNGAMFAVASAGAQVLLRRAYRPLVSRHPRHRWMLRAWLVLYAFVGIQMGWVLRPFIGDPTGPVEFFRRGAWDNAYVIVARMIWEQIAR